MSTLRKKISKRYTTLRVYKDDANLIRKEAVLNDKDIAEYIHKFLTDNIDPTFEILSDKEFYNNILKGTKEIKDGQFEEWEKVKNELHDKPVENRNKRTKENK